MGSINKEAEFSEKLGFFILEQRTLEICSRPFAAELGDLSTYNKNNCREVYPQGYDHQQNISPVKIRYRAEVTQVIAKDPFGEFPQQSGPKSTYNQHFYLDFLVWEQPV